MGGTTGSQRLSSLADERRFYLCSPPGDNRFANTVLPYVKNAPVYLCPSASPHLAYTYGRPTGLISPLVRLMLPWLPIPLATSTMIPVMPREEPLIFLKVAVPTPL